MKPANKKMLFSILIIFALCFIQLTASGSVLYAAEARTAPAKAAAVDYTVNNFNEYCDALNKTAVNLNDTVKIRINNFDGKIYDTAGLVDNLENTYPGLFYIESLDYTWKQDTGKAVIMTAKFTYSYPKNKLMEIRKQIDTKLNEILDKVTYEQMPLRDKELAIHDYVARNVKFDKQGEKSGNYPAESYDPYGALFKGAANSIGYARSMHMLMSRAGIENIIVFGESATWNIVKLDGEYYHVDACGDNIENKDGTISVVHDYFNISDDEMSKLNKWDRSIYPKCVSMKANYFYMNKTFVDSFDGYIDVLKEGIDNVRDLVSVKIADYDKERYDLHKALYKISDDYPDLDYIDFDKTVYYTNDRLGIVNVFLAYKYPKEELVSMKVKVYEKVDKIVTSIIKPEMTEYEKEKAIHDYLIFNAKYNKIGAEKKDVSFEEHDAYGVLIKGTGVCDSYAEAFKMLLNKVGIECITVSGDQKDGKDDDIGHAWSMVKLGGKYYHVDVTWDDREYDDGQNDLCYDYFNLTDENMAKDHEWNADDYPKCTNTDENYFYKNGKVVNNRSQAENLLRSSAGNKEVVVDMLITDYNSNTYDIRGMISRVVNNGSYGIKRASWTTNGIQGVVKITFEY